MTEFQPRLELPTPLELVNQIGRAQFYAKKGTAKVNELRRAYLKAKEAYSKAYKQTKIDLAQSGERMSQADRDDKAQLENWDLFVAMNEAEAVLQYAREKRDDLKDDLSAAQTESKLVMKELELAR